VLMGLLFGWAGRDVDFPFKLFRTLVWQSVDIHPRAASRTFNAEFLVSARRLGFEVAEIPVSHRRPLQGAPRRASRRQVTSWRFARSMRAAPEEPRQSPERRFLTPDP